MITTVFKLKKVLVLTTVIAAITQPLSLQAAQPIQHCDLYFSNGVVLKSIPTVDTDIQRRKGLSDRKTVGAGMLFVYQKAAYRTFWMHNTFIPLSAGFLDANGAIINIAHMKPNTDTLHKSEKPAKTVLELEEGGFTKHGLKVGERLETRVCQQRF